MNRNIPHKSIVLAIGKSCFLACRGCYNNFSCEEEVPKEEVITFVKYLKENHDISKVTVGGGDPLSRKDIVEILKEIKSLGIFINLDTTGLPLLFDTKVIFNGDGIGRKLEVADVINNIDVLGLPIDGANEDINKMFRAGREGFLQEELRLLNILNQYNVNICINTVVHKGNCKQLEEIADLLKQFKNIFKWQLFQFIPTGPIGYKNSDQFVISDSTYERRIRNLQNCMVEQGINIKLDPKSRTRRKNIYLLIDSNGDAWCPKTSTNKKWEVLDDSTDERIVWGNIRKREDWNRIVNDAFSYQGSL